jgi:hypothetical protein
MRFRAMALFSGVLIAIGALVYLIAYLNHPSGELTPEEQEIERKLALLPLPTPTSIPPSPTPTPVPIEAEINTDTLIEVLYNKEIFGNDPERARAARRLGDLRAKSAIPVLLGMLNDTTWFSSEDIRDACAIALGHIGDAAAEADLVKEMKNGRVTAATALSYLGTETAKQESLKYFREIQDSRRPHHRQMIVTLIEILGNFKLDNSIAPLIRAVERQDYEIGSAALSAIRKIGDVRAVPRLIELDQTAEPIRTDVIRTLNNLLMTDREFSRKIEECFSSSRNDIWTLHRDHYRSAVIEDGVISLFSSIPNDRLEQISAISLDHDFSLEIEFRKLKGRPEAEFGILIGVTQSDKLEFVLKPVFEDQNRYFEIDVTQVKGSRSSHIFRNRSQPISSAWSKLQLRVIDSVVTVFLDGHYIQSFQSQGCFGNIGLYLVGENHVVFNNLVITNISGPKILSAKVETPPADTSRPPVTVRHEEPAHIPEPRPAIGSDRKPGIIVVDIQAEYVTVGEVEIQIGGKVVSRISGDNLNNQATRGVLNFRRMYTGRIQLEVSPGRHTLSAYIAGRRQTNGASATFNIASGETKRISFVSKDFKDIIIVK